MDSTGSTSGPTGGFSGGNTPTKDGGKVLKLTYKTMLTLPLTYNPRSGPPVVKDPDGASFSISTCKDPHKRCATSCLPTIVAASLSQLAGTGIKTCRAVHGLAHTAQEFRRGNIFATLHQKSLIGGSGVSGASQDQIDQIVKGYQAAMIMNSAQWKRHNLLKPAHQ